MKVKKYYFFGIICCLVSMLTAQTHTFTGNGADTDWFNAMNWNSGTVPESSSHVFIPDGFEVEITASEAAAVTIELEGTARLIANNNLTIADALVVSLLSELTFRNGIITGGSIENEGTIRVIENTPKSTNNITINNNGLVETEDIAIWRLEGTTVINNSEDAVFRMKGTGSVTKNSGTATFNNDGLIQKSLGSAGFAASYFILEINNNGIIRVDENCTLLILSQQATLNNNTTGIMEGNGVYDITSDFMNSGTFSPGGELVGRLEVVNNFDFPSEATLRVDINGSQTGEYDLIAITGFPELSGTIEINVLSTLEEEDVFTILTANSIGSCNLPLEIYTEFNDTSYTFETICNPTSVQLRLASIEILGVDEVYEDKISFLTYPNPADNSFTISLNASEVVALFEDHIVLRIYNMLGQEVKSIENLSEGITKINRGSMQSGVYQLILELDGLNVASTKLILR